MRVRIVPFRQVVVALLMLALTMAGLGRAVAIGADPGPLSIVAAAPICHSIPGGPPAPADHGPPAGHDCCDRCALAAPVILPLQPDLAQHEPFSMVVRLGRPARPATRVARLRTPRQSQAPPAV